MPQAVAKYICHGDTPFVEMEKVPAFGVTPQIRLLIWEISSGTPH
jgi:hypothetical protein